MLNAREWVEDHLDDLDDAERSLLAQADADLLRLAREDVAHSLDAEYLRQTAEVVKASGLPRSSRAA